MIRALVLKDVRLIRYRLLVTVAVMGLLLGLNPGRQAPNPEEERRSRALFAALALHIAVSALVIQAGVLEEKSRAGTSSPAATCSSVPSRPYSRFYTS